MSKLQLDSLHREYATLKDELKLANDRADMLSQRLNKAHAMLQHSAAMPTLSILTIREVLSVLRGQ